MAISFKTPRKKNILDIEVSIVDDEISAYKDKFRGQFSSYVAKESKAHVWEQ